MKELKPFLLSMFIIILYVYATEGIVKWLWKTNNMETFKSRVFLSVVMLFIVSFMLIILPFGKVASPEEHMVYIFIIAIHFTYLLVGTIINTIVK